VRAGGGGGAEMVEDEAALSFEMDTCFDWLVTITKGAEKGTPRSKAGKKGGEAAKAAGGAGGAGFAASSYGATANARLSIMPALKVNHAAPRSIVTLPCHPNDGLRAHPSRRSRVL